MEKLEPSETSKDASELNALPEPALRENPVETSFLSELRIREWLLVLATIGAAGGALGGVFVAYSTETTLKGQLDVMRNQLVASNEDSRRSDRIAVATEKQAEASLRLSNTNAELLGITKNSSAAQREAERRQQAFSIEELEEEQRARLASNGTDLARALTPNQPIVANTRIVNQGREEAKYSRNLSFSTLPRRQANNPKIFKNMSEKKCAALTSTSPGMSLGPGLQLIIHTDRPWEAAFSKVQSGDDLLVISGCIRYITRSHQHTTALCYYYDPKYPNETNYMSTCPEGNFSD